MSGLGLSLKINIPDAESCMASVVPAAKLSPQSSARKKFNLVPEGEEMDEKWIIDEIIKEGDGETFPEEADEVKMHYEGFLVGGDEKKFESSIDKGKPYIFRIGLGRVISGWDEGIKEMSLGQECFLKVRSDYAYGERNIGNGLVPPNSDLRFFIQILEINKQHQVGEN